MNTNFRYFTLSFIFPFFFFFFSPFLFLFFFFFFFFAVPSAGRCRCCNHFFAADKLANNLASYIDVYTAKKLMKRRSFKGCVSSREPIAYIYFSSSLTFSFSKRLLLSFGSSVSLSFTCHLLFGSPILCPLVSDPGIIHEPAASSSSNTPTTTDDEENVRFSPVIFSRYTK